MEKSFSGPFSLFLIDPISPFRLPHMLSPPLLRHLREVNSLNGPDPLCRPSLYPGPVLRGGKLCETPDPCFPDQGRKSPWVLKGFSSFCFHIVDDEDKSYRRVWIVRWPTSWEWHMPSFYLSAGSRKTATGSPQEVFLAIHKVFLFPLKRAITQFWKAEH